MNLSWLPSYLAAGFVANLPFFALLGAAMFRERISWADKGFMAVLAAPPLVGMLVLFSDVPRIGVQIAIGWGLVWLLAGIPWMLVVRAVRRRRGWPDNISGTPVRSQTLLP